MTASKTTPLMIRFCALFSLAVAVITCSSCDSHTWEETQVLHEKYGAHGSSKDAHSAPADAAHGEKAKGHAPEAPKAAH
jgi:hypothetical protein